MRTGLKSRDRENVYATWFGRVVLIGVALNMVLGVYGLVAPASLLALFKLEPATPLVWARFSALLLLLLSLFYIPAGLQPLRQPALSILTVVARAAGVVFFGLFHGGAYLPFALYDLAFGLPQGVLLALALRRAGAAAPDRQDQGIPMPKTGASKRRWARALAAVALALVILAVPIGAVAWYKLFREVPTTFASDAEHFKYGPIGNEHTDGIPYPIWLVLPTVFPEHLPGPGGYEALGLIWEAGADVPIGLSKKTIGFPRVAINCAFCHTPVWRPDVDSPRVVAPGGASNTVDTQGYIRFLSNAASDSRFNADVLLEAISAEVELSWIDRLLYRYLLIPRTRDGLLEQKAAMAWTDSRPDWGPGRIDPFNPVKFGILGLADDGTIGNSDMQDVWNLEGRNGTPLHWDGLNTSVREVVVSSAVGDGATGKHIDWASLDRIERFLRETKPPPFPFPHNGPLAARGAEIFARECAVCHGSGGERTGSVIPVDEVGTDPHRVAMWTDAAREAYNAYDEGYDWNFSHFQNVEGYVAQALDGVWLRAPYLHNGSVPTLRDLLGEPARRPRSFYRGFDVYDPEAMGFVTDPEAMGPAAGSGIEIRGFYYDTTVPGNGNQGHTYGTNLPDEDKEALVEYLKTL